jgi:hypothetical protein
VPGATVPAAVEAFLDPLREAAACFGGAHFTLSPGSRGNLGAIHFWTLNNDRPVELGEGVSFRASMHFEILDIGQGKRRGPFRVTTRGYMYAVIVRDQELLAAHWHPTSSSPFTEPHWHIGAAALAADGVYLERAHIPSPRVSFEKMIRFMIEQMGVPPHREDWSERLERSEALFREHSSW